MRKAVCILGVLVSTLYSFTARGESHSQAIEQFDYPELSVVPRASDRLKLEAAKEPGRGISTFLPVQVSALTTLVAGAITVNPAQTGVGYLGVAVGGGWLALSTYLALTYHPYEASYAEIVRMPKSNTREQLTRERNAEEELQSISRAGERIKWLSVVTNLGTTIYMMSQGNPAGGNSSNVVTGAQVASAIMSLCPLVFPIYWHEVYEEQIEYKKKIYAPVARATLLYDQAGQKFVPGFGLSMSF